MLRVVFLGNHTVGVKVLEALKQCSDLVGAIAHPDDPEDGVVYESVFDWCVQKGVSVLRAKGRDRGAFEFVKALNPDLLFIADYRYLIPKEMWTLAKHGAINLHPSLLPKYRGRASINWAILNGETELGLTAHYVEEGTDTGDILSQKSYSLDHNEDVNDALNKLYPLYHSITVEVIEALAQGTSVRKKQEHSEASEFPRRTPKDGAINWQQESTQVLNLVRAVAPPYPGAFSGDIVIHKARSYEGDLVEELTSPGDFVEKEGRLLFMCKDKPIEVIEWVRKDI